MAKWTKKLTELSEKIGAETHIMNNDGEMLSKDEVLIRQTWDEALGWTETTIDDDGNTKIVKHKPQRWAKELLWSRREGGIPAAPENVGQQGLTAAEKVRELQRNKANELAKKAMIKNKDQSDSK